MNYGLMLGVDYMRLERMAVTEDAPMLPVLYKAIGCDMVEIVRVSKLPANYVLVVDEEGLLKEKPSLNVIGSYLYGTYKHDQPIVGNAVIMKEVMTDEGIDLAWLTKKEIDWLEERMEKDIWNRAVTTMSHYFSEKQNVG